MCLENASFAIGYFLAIQAFHQLRGHELDHVIGIAIGVAAAFGLMRLLKSLLFEVQTTDVSTFGIVVGALFLVTLLACYVPARRATKVDPLGALRYE